MKRTLIALLLALALVTIPVGTAFADNPEEVTITADPNWVISITAVEDNWAPGTGIPPKVDKASTYWFSVTEPTWPLTLYTDTVNYIENTGTEAVDISITGADFTGGINGWTLVASDTPALDEAQLTAWSNDPEHNELLLEGVILTVAGSPFADFVNDLPDTGSDKAAFELRLVTAANFRDAVQKVTTITLTAAQSF